MTRAKDEKDASGRESQREEDPIVVESAELISAHRLLEGIELKAFEARAYEVWRATVQVLNFVDHARHCESCREYYLGSY